MPIENVSDTARWVAVYRAMETARPDAIFRDPFAARLAGERGAAIVRDLKGAKQMAWAMIVRTAVLDEMIMRRVASGEVDTVINLAAGLDARAWRLPLPPALRWFDVDLPAMTEYKAGLMQGERPVCAYEAIAADLTDVAVTSAVLHRITGRARAALVITEGLLIYLGDDDVAALARALRAEAAIRWWVSDVASPTLLGMLNRGVGVAVAAGNAPFRFAPADSARFFAPLGWRQTTFRSSIEEATRLRREMPGWWIRKLGMRFAPAAKREEIRRLSGYIELERA